MKYSVPKRAEHRRDADNLLRGPDTFGTVDMFVGLGIVAVEFGLGIVAVEFGLGTMGAIHRTVTVSQRTVGGLHSGDCGCACFSWDGLDEKRGSSSGSIGCLYHLQGHANLAEHMRLRDANKVCHLHCGHFGVVNSR